MPGDKSEPGFTLDPVFNNVLLVLDGLLVAAESVPDADEFKGLHKIERDADLDAIVLVVYWNRPEDETRKHPWHDHLRDLHFKAQPAGVGAAASVERFVRFDEEEKKKMSWACRPSGVQPN